MFIPKIWRSWWKDEALGFRIFIILLKTVSAECLFGLFNGRILYLIEDSGAVADKVNYASF